MKNPVLVRYVFSQPKMSCRPFYLHIMRKEEGKTESKKRQISKASFTMHRDKALAKQQAVVGLVYVINLN